MDSLKFFVSNNRKIVQFSEFLITFSQCWWLIEPLHGLQFSEFGGALLLRHFESLLRSVPPKSGKEPETVSYSFFAIIVQQQQIKKNINEPPSKLQIFHNLFFNKLTLQAPRNWKIYFILLTILSYYIRFPVAFGYYFQLLPVPVWKIFFLIEQTREFYIWDWYLHSLKP